MTIGVYMIEHLATGRRYVGKSVDVHKRRSAHFSAGQRRPLFIHRAIAKYGASAFTWTLLEECQDDLTSRAREVHWIKTLGTMVPNGFNLTEGGDGMVGYRPSAATIAKQIAARRGTKRSLETRRRMSVAQKGRVITDSARAKLSIAAAGQPRSLGRVLGPETRAKIAAGNRGKTISDDVRSRTSATLKGRVPARNLREVSAETRLRLSASGTGRRHSEETKEKMRQAHINRRNAEREIPNG